MATKQLAQLISKRKPSFWRSFLDGANKSRVYSTLSEEKIVFLCQTFYGKTTPISGTFLFSHPVYNFPVLFDLNYDPQELIELNLIKPKTKIGLSSFLNLVSKWRDD